jgi:hypothetical protein
MALTMINPATSWFEVVELPAVGLFLNLEAARQGRNVLLSDEQNLLLKETKKGSA